MTPQSCSICDREDIPTPYETPDDPPFFPAGGGHHCQECDDWLSQPAETS